MSEQPKSGKQRSPIIIDGLFDLLAPEDQEYFLRLSRTQEVFYKNLQGELVQILDLTNGNEESVRLYLHTDKDNPPTTSH